MVGVPPRGRIILYTVAEAVTLTLTNVVASLAGPVTDAAMLLKLEAKHVEESDYQRSLHRYLIAILPKLEIFL
jgi:hypothetical protein